MAEHALRRLRAKGCLIDLLACIVLAVLVITAVAILIALGMMPDHIARKRRHPWAEALTVGSWPHARVLLRARSMTRR